MTCLDSDDNVVDRDVNQLNKEADESHNQESNTRGGPDLCELFHVRLGAPVH